MLTLSGVYAGYGGGDVLQGVDLEVPERSVCCIVGPNGAGKSTVLRAVSGLLVPREGLGRAQRRDVHCFSCAVCGTSTTPSAACLTPPPK